MAHRAEADVVVQRIPKDSPEKSSCVQSNGQGDGLPGRAVMSDPLLALPACPRFFPYTTIASRIPWPAEARSAPLNVTPESLRTMVHCPAPLIRLAYRLFYLPLAQAEALLSLAVTAARDVLIVDFKCAERNLELPSAVLAACLRGRGPAHASSFMRSGGLEGMVHRLQLKVSARHTLLGGAAVMLRISAQRGL